MSFLSGGRGADAAVLAEKQLESDVRWKRDSLRRDSEGSMALRLYTGPMFH